MSGAGVLGVVGAAGLLYSNSILIRPQRGFEDVQGDLFMPQVVVEENHRDETHITEHPVEQGANITDHAFDLPPSLTVRYGWSNSPSARNLLGAAAFSVAGTLDGVQSLVTGNQTNQMRDIYDRLLKLKTNRIPFTVYTGKRKYADMMIRTITVMTEKDHEQSMLATIELRQVLRVRVIQSLVTAAAASQASPQLTSPPAQSGTKSLSTGDSYNPAGGGKGF